jgi:hypothetical protein
MPPNTAKMQGAVPCYFLFLQVKTGGFAARTHWLCPLFSGIEQDIRWGRLPGIDMTVIRRRAAATGRKKQNPA